MGIPGLDMLFGPGGQNVQNEQLQQLMGLLQGGNSTITQGQQNLAGIIGGQGASDPRLLNRMMTNIDRGTEGQQQALGARLAQGGLQGSGIGAALQAAIGQGGQNRRVAAQEREIMTQESRKRNDLGLILQQLINPQMQGIGQQIGMDQFNSNLAQQNKAASMALVGDLAGAAIPLCWVARAVYGEDDMRWLFARHYVLNIGPGWFKRLYRKYGERLGAFVKKHPAVRAAVKPIFDRFVRRAVEDCHARLG